jgi:uncharacterized protein YdhG (YjbR/CyaY superfamily)
MNDRPADIDGYLAKLPEDARATLEGLRRTIKATAPEADESISYGVPTFKYRGRPLAYFGAAKRHCALYGLPMEPFKDELAAYDTAKGTIRFPPGEPPPEALVRKLVEARMMDIEAAPDRRSRGRSAGDATQG